MERELRALGEGARQHEQQRGQVEGARPDQIGLGADNVYVVAARDPADEEEAQQQAHPARARDDQRHARALAGALIMMPIADEQEGEEARQLPEEGELDEVAGQHQAQHRSHEGEQEREEPRHRIFRRHIIARIQHHERADAEDEKREDPAKSIEPQDEVEADIGRPEQVHTHYPAIGHGRIEGSEDRKARQRQQAAQRRGGGARIGWQQGSEQAADEGQQQHQGKQAFVAHRAVSSPVGTTSTSLSTMSMMRRAVLPISAR